MTSVQQFYADICFTIAVGPGSELCTLVDLQSEKKKKKKIYQLGISYGDCFMRFFQDAILGSGQLKRI